MPDCTFCGEDIPVGTKVSMVAWCVELVPEKKTPGLQGQPDTVKETHYIVPNTPYCIACAVRMVQNHSNGAGGHPVVAYQRGDSYGTKKGFFER